MPRPAKRIALTWLLFGMAMMAATGEAAPGTITTSLSTAGPVPVGGVFSATVTMSGYTDSAEIDGFNFKVNFDPAQFSVLGVVFEDATGPEENWLRKAPQDNVVAGGILTDFTTTAPGELHISAADMRLASTRGTLASAGFLCQVSFQVIGLGSGLITPSAASGGTVLFDSNLSPVAVPVFGGTNVNVTSAPLISQIARNGANVDLTWFAVSNRSYRVQFKTNLTTAPWTDLPGDVIATGPNGSKTDSTTGSASQRYYRVALLP